MTSKPHKLIVVLGPTASGKSNAAVDLAKHLDTEIISCDSRQFYMEIPIGTAAPTPAEQGSIPHYFVGNRSLTEEYSAGQFAGDALRLLNELFIDHDTVVMVGGSGLYIDAVCDGMDDIPSDPAVREQLKATFEQEGLEPLTARLKELDPEYYDVVDRNNPQRVIRALEACLVGGKPYSTLRKGNEETRNFDAIKIGLTMPREQLYNRINRRVDNMMEAGLEEEARKVYPLKHLNSLRTVGYRELFRHFDGEISKEEAVELIKQNSRRYAKRQMTWFGRDGRINWFDASDPDYMWRIVEFLDPLVK